MQQIEYPWLAQLSRWIDQAHEFLNLINGGVLWLGLAISLTDVLTDGWLTLAFGWLLIVWAVSQAVGVDSFIYHFSARARAHFDKKDWLPLVITAGVIGALGFVAWQAAYIFGAAQVDHISISAAINSLGMSEHDWLKLRFAGSVAMVVLSGFTRYIKAPAKGAAAIQVIPEAPQSTTPEPQAVVSPDLRKGIRLVSPRAESLRKAPPRESVRPRARAAWEAGARSKPAMMREANISNASAAKYIAEFSVEDSGSLGAPSEVETA